MVIKIKLLIGFFSNSKLVISNYFDFDIESYSVVNCFFGV